MKAIINGKRYNTETATEVASWSNHASYSDFNHCEETLYRTPKGNWFTVGSGGPMSKYARSLGNNTRGGSSDVFTALTANEARAWLESNQETAALEEHFADTIDDA